MRFLSPDRKRLRKPRLTVFDFETEDWSKALGCGILNDDGYVCYRREGRSASGAEALCDKVVDHLIRFCRGHIVFSHNGGKFDILLLIKSLNKRKDVKCRFVVSGSSIVCVTIETGGKSLNDIYLYDSYRIFQQPLAKLGESIGISKMSIDYSEIDKKDWESYLYRDCEILWKCVSQLSAVLNELNCNLKPTAGATAISVFRRNFLSRRLRLEDEGGEWLRPYFAGGRTEAFNLNVNAPCYVYDVNSMYPFVMRKYTFPIGNPVVVKGDSANEYLAQSSELVSFIGCDVEIPPSMNIPNLPYKKDGKLLFPVGKFSGVWDSIELATLKKYCPEAKIKVKWAKVYPALPLFSSFIETMYDIRKKGGIYKIAGKLLANSFYGKFAEGTIKKAYHFNPDVKEMLDKLDERDNVDLEIPELNIWSTEVDRIPKHTNVAIAAHVTACARTELYEYMMLAQSRGAKVYYVDTDSLFLSKKVFEDSSELGGLKLEGAWGIVTIIGPKMYALTSPLEGTEEKVKAKGFRKLTVEEFYRLVGGEKIHLRAGLGQFRSIIQETRRLYRTGSSKKLKSELDVWVMEMDKGLISSYDKRTVLQSNGPGNETVPLVINESGVDWKNANTKWIKELLARGENE